MAAADRSDTEGDVRHAADGDGPAPREHPAATSTNPHPLRWKDIPADATRLVGVRRALQDWALAAGLTDATAEDVVLASYEAMANAAEHAYRSGPGTIDLLASYDDDEVVVTVRDRGAWRPPPADPGHRGRGLVMIRSMSRAEVEPGPDGTTVRMRWSRGR